MKHTLLLLICLLTETLLIAQPLRPDLHDKEKWDVVRRQAETVAENGAKAVQLSKEENDGLMILKNFELEEGVIEFDVKGENVVGQSFVGLAFHLQDENTFDAIYFRPFNFMNPDTVRRSRAVQYISSPEWGWEKLRLQYPGKYENKISPVPDTNGWFHARVDIDGKNIRVFVNNAPKPTLVVQKISTFDKGKIALWVGNGSRGSFSNLVITKKK